MRKSKQADACREFLLPGELVKRTEEAMAAVKLEKLIPKAIVFVTMLVRRSLSWKAYWLWKGPFKPWFVPVEAARARKSFKPTADYKRMINALLAAGIIEKGRNHSQRVRCREYRVSPALLSSPRVIYQIIGKPAAAIIRGQNKAEPARPLRCQLPVFESQVATLRRVVLLPAAQEMLDRVTCKAERQGRVIDVFYQHSLHRLGRMHSRMNYPDRLLLKEDHQGRLHSPMTNFPKCFRQHLRLDGEELVSLDLVSSHPFFLTVLLDEIAKALDAARQAGSSEPLREWDNALTTRLGTIPAVARVFHAYLSKRFQHWPEEETARTRAELRTLRDLVLSGELYAETMSRTGDKGDAAKLKTKYKRRFFHILYGGFMNIVKTEEWRGFARRFPRVAREVKMMRCLPRDPDWVAAVKGCKPTKVLARLLMAMEARLLFDTLCPALTAVGIEFITIHDCVLVKASESAAAKRAWDQAFDQVGLHPRVKVAPLAPTQVPRSRPVDFEAMQSAAAESLRRLIAGKQEISPKLL